MKIYTKSGDEGNTNLADGTRAAKNSLRIEAYGTVDELNSFIGLARATTTYGDMKTTLSDVQKQLFVLGADLATPYGKVPEEKSLRIEGKYTEWLENKIGQLEGEIKPLKKFVLPGGSIGAAYLHVARTVARRCERRILSLSQTEKINPSILPYINRLSTLLFVMARFENQLNNQEETTWGREGMLGI